MNPCVDVLLQVLSLLPPKASARFKSVCRSWNHLISTSSYLQSLHKRCVDHGNVIGFYHGSKSLEQLRFCKPPCDGDGNEDEDETCVDVISAALKGRNQMSFGSQICATCNGFFLLKGAWDFDLRNPLIDARVIIRQSPPNLHEPASARLWYFGLSASLLSTRENEATNKLSYEIMSLAITKDLVSSSGFTYSSSTKTWTPLEIDESVLQQLNSPQSCLLKRFYCLWETHPYLNPIGATFLNQSFHWLFDDGRIFAFDLTQRRWRHMKTPAVGEHGKTTLIENNSDIISSAIENVPFEERTEGELVNKLCCYLYPNIWLGAVGDHIYLLLVIDRTNLQLWILDNYDDVEWKMIVDVKSCAYIAPVFFDGRLIFVAAFDFEEWKRKKGVIRFFDTFTSKWLATSSTITEYMDKIRFFFPSVRCINDSLIKVS